MLSLAEAIEYLFAEHLAKRPLDEAALEKARKAARKELADEEKCPVRDILEWTDTIEAHSEACWYVALRRSAVTPRQWERQDNGPSRPSTCLNLLF